MNPSAEAKIGEQVTVRLSIPCAVTATMGRQNHSTKEEQEWEAVSLVESRKGL